MKRYILMILLFFVFPAWAGSLTACGAACAGRMIGSHAIMYTGMAGKSQIALAASASHAGMIRIDFSWNGIETSPGTYDWTQEDGSVAAAQQYGLPILAVIYGTPSFYSSDPSGPSDGKATIYQPTSPTGYDAWVAFLQAAVARYSSVIQYWEIYPEPETTQQWLSGPSAYAHLFSVAYTTVKAANSAMQVLIGGETQNNQPGFFNAVINDSSYPNANHIDYVVAHARGTVSQIQAYVNGWIAIYAAQGIIGKPFWITEFGFPSSPSDQVIYDPNFEGTDVTSGQQDQAAYYNVVVPWMLTNGVTRLFVTLRDVQPPPFSSEGIIDTTASVPKLAFQTIQQLSDHFSAGRVPSAPPTLAVR